MPVNLDVFLKYRDICLSILDIDSIWIFTQSVHLPHPDRQPISFVTLQTCNKRFSNMRPMWSPGWWVGDLGKVMAILR